MLRRTFTWLSIGLALGVVATMWLGTDQGDDPDGPPLIFGTVLRDLSIGGVDIEVEWFAATETQALENQTKLVATLTNAPRGNGHE